MPADAPLLSLALLGVLLRGSQVLLRGSQVLLRSKQALLRSEQVDRPWQGPHIMGSVGARPDG